MYRAFSALCTLPLASRCIWQPLARLPGFAPRWGSEAIALAEHARVLSGNKLAQLVRRLQRQTGRTQEECWRFVIKYGIKAEVDHRRWHQEELDEARELLTKYSVEEVAKRLNRSPKALRNALQRRQLSVREIRCDCFSLESLAQVLHVRRSEMSCWIEQGWLQATITKQGNRSQLSHHARSPECSLQAPPRRPAEAAHPKSLALRSIRPILFFTEAHHRRAVAGSPPRQTRARGICGATQRRGFLSGERGG